MVYATATQQIRIAINETIASIAIIGMRQPIMRPAFALRPLRVVGIPVAFAKLRFADVMPSARL